jgi:hypothetical protein
LNRRLVVLCGLAAALALAATLVPGADDDDATVVGAAPRSGGPRPAPGVTGPDGRKEAPTIPDAASPGVASPAVAVPAAAAVPRAAAASGGPLRTTLRASADLFPAPPAAPVVAAPAPPPPPPAPPPRPRFVLIGRLVDAGGPTAIVRQGEQVLTLRVGDRSGGFRMTALDDEAATFLHEVTGSSSRIVLGDATGATRGRAQQPAAPAPTEEEAPSAD